MAKPKLYQLSISPTCQRVFATLANKGVEYDVVEIDISQKERPDEFNSRSPFGKVPVFEHDGNVIIESACIINYINDVWPEPPMMPSDAAGKAYARRWMQFADREMVDRDADFVHVERDATRKRELCAKVFTALPHLEAELANKTELFLGPDLSLVDCMMAPTLVFLPIWSAAIGDNSFAGMKNIHAYTDRLKANPVLEKSVYNVPIDVYEGFFNAILKDGLTIP